jgi:hypothetical protein
MPFLDLPRSFVPVKVGHSNVEQHRVWGEITHKVESLLRAIRSTHLVAIVA